MKVELLCGRETTVVKGDDEVEERALEVGCVNCPMKCSIGGVCVCCVCVCECASVYSSVCSVGVSTTPLSYLLTDELSKVSTRAKPKARKLAFVFTSSESFVRPRVRVSNQLIKEYWRQSDGLWLGNVSGKLFGS